MANARTRYDVIAGHLARAHGATQGLLYGRPSIELDGKAFAAFVRDALALRLHGRVLAQALALPGAQPWQPREVGQAAPGWVLLPASLMLRWDRLALEALRCARERAQGPVSLRIPEPVAAAEAPPPSTPASLAERVGAAVARRFGGMRALRS